MTKKRDQMRKEVDARKLGTLLAQPQILAPRPIRTNSWACEKLESCDTETGELNSTMIWNVLVDIVEALMEGRFSLMSLRHEDLAGDRFLATILASGSQTAL
ncbi:hypothetical protein VFPPC_17847 [Pochonia chlamydosporia 170]|uniref:Uncharacterized protein n=1 Tax=Pochonia chlamydosporia 170 TaxID=1380566 RepID=A0A219AQ93_METCM|nr:hypothetical protein VFPPC_17847 [Pochonia chlamydosporia 170]OWT42960.1 hypothetical protein VFPPC_17847 [Pochonia chlamydosporia 170]